MAHLPPGHELGQGEPGRPIPEHAAEPPSPIYFLQGDDIRLGPADRLGRGFQVETAAHVGAMVDIVGHDAYHTPLPPARVGREAPGASRASKRQSPEIGRAHV